MFQKTAISLLYSYIPLDIHRKSGRAHFALQKNMGFKVLVICFSHSKFSKIQRNYTSPNRWGRPDFYASFSIDFSNGLAAGLAAMQRGNGHCYIESFFSVFSNLLGVCNPPAVPSGAAQAHYPQASLIVETKSWNSNFWVGSKEWM